MDNAIESVVCGTLRINKFYPDFLVFMYFVLRMAINPTEVNKFLKINTLKPKKNNIFYI